MLSINNGVIIFATDDSNQCIFHHNALFLNTAGLQDTARRIAKVCIECKIALDEEEYVQSFKSSLMDVVHAWCTGAKFADICKMTDVFEGSIIRAMRRLEELLREMSLAAKAIGNTELENKFAEGAHDNGVLLILSKKLSGLHVLVSR